MQFVRFLFSLFLLIQLFSCTSSAPYEIKSPCVSGGGGSPYYMTPCIKKPMGYTVDLS